VDKETKERLQRTRDTAQVMCEYIHAINLMARTVCIYIYICIHICIVHIAHQVDKERNERLQRTRDSAQVMRVCIHAINPMFRC